MQLTGKVNTSMLRVGLARSKGVLAFPPNHTRLDSACPGPTIGGYLTENYGWPRLRYFPAKTIRRRGAGLSVSIIN